MRKKKYSFRRSIKEKNERKDIHFIKVVVIQFLILILFLLFCKFDIKKNYNISLYNKQLDNIHHVEHLDLNMEYFQEKIHEFYNNNYYVNLNEIESKIDKGRLYKLDKEKKIINFGFQLDPNYIMRAMITLASIMESQYKTTKIKFHFAVVLNFDIKAMLKIYSLRKRLREDVEFIFYNAKRVETDLKGLNTKGPGAVAKLLLPQLLPNDIERILVFDTGDLLIIKDLSEAYNWDISGYLYAGVPARSIGKYAKISKKPFDIYISVGSFLINVKRVKEENMYQKFIKYKNYYSHSSIGDQDLLNDVAFGKITYLPFKFGMICPYLNDKDAENIKKETIYSYTKIIRYKDKYTFLPKTEEELLKMGYNPSVIHHMHSKWMYGQGLTVYRKLAQYYIKLAGIWDEICKEYAGYCENK